MSRYYDDELYHHGIKGQRWGVRRFQNPDGSLKSAGAKRYGVASSIKSGQAANDVRTGRSKYRTAVSEAKANRKSRDAAIQKRVYAEEERIERGYKRGQALSDKDYARELAADNKARADWAASKQQYKSDIKSAKEQYKADMKAEREGRKGLSDRQKTALKVGAVAVAAGLAAYGAHKYVKSTNAQAHKAVEDVFNNQMAKERFYGKIDAIGKGMEGAAAEKYGRNTALSASRNIYTHDQRQAHMKGLAKDLRRYQAGQARDKVLNKMNIKTARSSANPLDLYRDYYINEIENANKYRYKRVGKF